ncbi:hypothetical protein REPUB_Repub15cG0026700 [Reevesia pubescens]
MASIDKPTEVEAAPPVAASKCPSNYSVVDVALRVLLFAASLSSVVVMVTSKQTELLPVPGLPNVRLPLPAKFDHSPAFIYFIAALSVTGFYSMITTLASVSLILKPTYNTSFLLVFAFLDALFMGIVASATGAAGSVAYIGLKGNSHVGWNKICGVYDKFCRHIGSSVALSLFAAILLVLLTMMSTFNLYKKIRD